MGQSTPAWGHWPHLMESQLLGPLGYLQSPGLRQGRGGGRIGPSVAVGSKARLSLCGCVCMCVHFCSCFCGCRYVCAYVHVYVFLYVCVCVHFCLWFSVCTWVHVCISLYVSVHVCVCLCLCVHLMQEVSFKTKKGKLWAQDWELLKSQSSGEILKGSSEASLPSPGL